MIIKLSLTKDELKWLRDVTCYGTEVTRYLKRTMKLFKDKRDWDEIQFKLYRKVTEL